MGLVKWGRLSRPHSWPCARLPSGDVSIGIKCAPGVVGPAEADIDFDIIKNDNDTFTVKYTPPGAGRYTIMVLFANQVPHPWLLAITGGPHPPSLSRQLDTLSRGDNFTATDQALLVRRQRASEGTKGELFQKLPLPTLTKSFFHPGDPCQPLPY